MLFPESGGVGVILLWGLTGLRSLLQKMGKRKGTGVTENAKQTAVHQMAGLEPRGTSSVYPPVASTRSPPSSLSIASHWQLCQPRLDLSPLWQLLCCRSPVDTPACPRGTLPCLEPDSRAGELPAGEPPAYPHSPSCWGHLQGTPYTSPAPQSHPLSVLAGTMPMAQISSFHLLYFSKGGSCPEPSQMPVCLLTSP